MNEQQLATMLMETVPRAMHVLRVEMRNAAVPDLTVPQFRILAHLRRQQRGNNELAELQGVSVAAMSRMAATLIEKKFLRRQTHPGDRRAVQLELTPKGRQRLERLRAHVTQKIVVQLKELNLRQKSELAKGLSALEEFFS